MQINNSVFNLKKLPRIKKLPDLHNLNIFKYLMFGIIIIISDIFTALFYNFTKYSKIGSVT